MENEYYDDYESEIVQSQPMQFGLTTLEPLSLSQPNTRAHRQLARRAEIDTTSEQYKARLMQGVIMNTTALSAIADQASAMVPSAEQPVREAVRIYARSSTERIAQNW